MSHAKKARRSAKRLVPIGEDGIAAIRAIVKGRQAQKVNEVFVDTFSASAILAVYDALSAENQEKLRSMCVAQVADVAFKVLRRVKP